MKIITRGCLLYTSNELEIIAGQAILPEESFLWLKTDELATFFTWTTIYLSKDCLLYTSRCV